MIENASSFSDFPLHPDILKAVQAMGYERPTPVQARSIGPALAGSDVLGSAQTGSGKTVAFTLPLLDRLLRDPGGPREGRALVLTPTRELAAQVEASIKECGQFTRLRYALVIGGASWGAQTSALRGADIVVATPGRLLDHLRNNRGFKLDRCGIAVLDEADRMLDMGFLPDVQAILERLPRSRQTLMFSATVPPDIERLVGRFMNAPVRVQVDPPRAPASGITQKVYPVSLGQKYDLLVALLKSFGPAGSVLVFTGTKRKADVVGGILKSKGIQAAVMHSDLSQGQRNQALEGFRTQRHAVLVATDIAARGLDIRHVTHVVNFDIPSYAEDYLHRIGRTARAFTIGDAVSLMCPADKGLVTAIEAFIGQPIERCALEGFPYDVPPKLEVYRPPAHAGFRRLRRSSRTRRGLF